LCYLAYRIATAEPALAKSDRRAASLGAAYPSTFLLTLANPTTVLSFIGVFAAMGVGVGGPGYATASLLVLGVVLGSALWWLILSFGVSLFRHRLTARALRWVNYVSGGIIAAFGVIALLSVF
jgi:threonine/homoserine/homoserine lactone efflux protein